MGRGMLSLTLNTYLIAYFLMTYIIRMPTIIPADASPTDTKHPQSTDG